MKTADLIESFKGQTFNSHDEAITWLHNQCQRLELDAYRQGGLDAAKLEFDGDYNDIRCPEEIINDYFTSPNLTLPE
jgi:hypothetical protein